jgi:KTSC domain
MTVQHRPIESSHLKSAALDPINRTLEVKFHDGSVYRYRGVSQEEYNQLLASPSAGQFMHHNIKPLHDCTQVK